MVNIKTKQKGLLGQSPRLLDWQPRVSRAATTPPAPADRNFLNGRCLTQLSTSHSRGMQIASCKLPVETRHCADPWLPGRQPGRGRAVRSWTWSGMVPQAPIFSPKNSAFRAYLLVHSLPANPAFSQTNHCQGATMETLEVLRRGRLPTLHPRQPGHRFPRILSKV